MKRRTFISTAAAATAATGLAACGSGTPGQRADAPGAEGRVTVEFWAGVYTTPENSWYENVVESFNDSQDDVFVNLQVVPGDAWDQRLTAAQAAGNAPDVYVQAGRLDTDARTGLLMPLDDLFEADAFSSISEVAAEVCQFQGEWYGFPLLVEPQMTLFWNKDMFEEAGLDPDAPPASWDDLYEACEALAPLMGNGEFALNTAVDSGTFGWTTVAAQMHVAGHLPISDDWSTAEAEDPAYEELIDFYKTLQDEGWIPRQPLGEGNSAQAFGEGKVAMMSQGSWGMSELAADYADVLPVTGLAPWVQSDGDLTHSVSTIGNMKWVVDAKAQEPDAAATFIQWALAGGDDDVLAPFFVDTQFTKAPGREDLAEVVNSDPAADDAPWSDAVFEDIVPFCIPEAQYPWDINMAMGDALQAGMLGEKSPSEALSDANTEIQRVIDREGLADVRAEMDA